MVQNFWSYFWIFSYCRSTHSIQWWILEVVFAIYEVTSESSWRREIKRWLFDPFWIHSVFQKNTFMNFLKTFVFVDWKYFCTKINLHLYFIFPFEVPSYMQPILFIFVASLHIQVYYHCWPENYVTFLLVFRLLLFCLDNFLAFK